MTEQVSVLQQIRAFGQLMHRHSRHNIELDDVIAKRHPEITQLPMMQKHVLHYIIQKSTCHEVYQRDIERHFYIRRSTASTILKSLEEQHFITRVQSKTDGRLKTIIVSNEIRQAFVEVYQQVEEKMTVLEQQVTKNISQEELQQFLQTLNKMTSNIENEKESKKRGQKDG